MSQSHRNEGRTTDEAFQEQRSRWERGASVSVDSLTDKTFNMHTNL